MNFIITLIFGKIRPLNEMDFEERRELANQLRDRRVEPRPFIDVVNARLEKIVKEFQYEENEERKLFWCEFARQKYGSLL